METKSKKSLPPITSFWEKAGFEPNDSQKKAILHIDGPLFLTAGPGSGKTRVLLWRTLNLIVFHGVDPSKIFLSTFTEKAAKQLQDGLRSLLSLVTNETGRQFDIAAMSVGTVHSICQKLLSDRRFTHGHARGRTPALLDELGQYFFVYNRRNWQELVSAGGFEDAEIAQRQITEYVNGRENYSRHQAVLACIAFWNRLSEEKYEAAGAKEPDETLAALLAMYDRYKRLLTEREGLRLTDLSLLQQNAYLLFTHSPAGGEVFEHVIVDEYQDTNTIQEKIFFTLAKGSGNICVVGDDDQALYRFRGATVENLVEFEDRCNKYLGKLPRRIDLSINYRSRKKIVEFYSDFITRIEWADDHDKSKSYRVKNKKVEPDSGDRRAAVLVSEEGPKEDVCREIVRFIKKLKAEGKVEDYSQVAMLFPSMKGWGEKNTYVQCFQTMFDECGIPHYAPRAGRFLEVSEARDVIGVFLEIFGKPEHRDRGNASRGWREYQDWLAGCRENTAGLIKSDAKLKEFIRKRASEVETAANDYVTLREYCDKKTIDLKIEFKPEWSRQFSGISEISLRASKGFQSHSFNQALRRAHDEGKPYPVSYALNRVTALDWNPLDLFYQLGAFTHFRRMYDLAECGDDEGPICNLGLLSQYLSRFLEDTSPVLSGQFLSSQMFVNKFFSSFLYSLFRLGESEYEDQEDPFPKGRVSFMTIHQAKGLEFPVVILGSLRRGVHEASQTEKIARKLTERGGEPIDRISEFDNARMFYVALSRAQNLLILPRYKGRGQYASEPFKSILTENKLPALSSFNRAFLPREELKEQDLGRTYSYTGDYLQYNKCPRNYMIFRKYGFVPSRTQTMFFGSLVHETIEDLHHHIMDEREKTKGGTP